MGIRLINYVNNQLQTPALYTDAFAGRPAAGIYGRLFMSTDTKEIFQDLTTTWQLLADAGAGAGTLQSVCTNGSTTNTGITILSNNLALSNAASSFYIKALTVGSVLFCDDASGLVSQDNTNFFWDNTNNRLGLGTAAPSARLDVHSSSGTSAILNGTGASNALLTFQNTGTSKWSIGNFVSSTVANDFNIYDTVNSVSRLQVHNTGVINIPTSLIIGTTTPTSIYAFDVTGTSRFTAAITGTSATFSSSVTSSFNGFNALAAYGFTSYEGAAASGKNIQFTLGIFTSVDAIYQSSGNTNDFGIYTNGGSTSQAKLYIKNGGNVLIGTTTDSGSKFSVLGEGNFGNPLSGQAQILIGLSTGPYIKMNGPASNNTFGNSSNLYLFDALNSRGNGFQNNTSQNLCIFHYNAGWVNIGNFNNSTGTYTATSDINKKKDFELSTIGLNAILGLKPTLYRMIKENNTEKHLGFIAQEVKDFIPQAFVNDEDFIGLDYQAITATLVKAIQELNEKLVRNNIN